MRLALGVLSVLATTSVAAGKPSNPAFLGIGMHDEPDGCHVDNVTRGSGAKTAGMRPGDVIAAIDKLPTPTCNAVLASVQGHTAGDRVELVVVAATDATACSASSPRGRARTPTRAVHRRWRSR